jgi:DNA-binding CsgD family transcriptional regulator
MASKILHSGTPRHSGRYPWGSGKDGYQRDGGFQADVSDLRKKGLSSVDIAKNLGLKNTSELRIKIAIEGNKRDAARQAMAYRLKEKGYSDIAIAKRMGISDHTVADLLNPSIRRKAQITEEVVNALKNEIDKSPYGVDVGVGVEIMLGTSGTRKDLAVAILKDQGYNYYKFDQEQQGAPGKYTHMKVLAPPNVTEIEVKRNRDQIKAIGVHSDDGGETFQPILPPISLSRKRVFVRYGDDEPSGKDKDGAIELRRNVEDLSLGAKRAAQVRIAVDGTHYMKGMAIYSDNVPDGYDIVYNSNKTHAQADKVFKPIETKDPDYPFGAVVRQKFYIDKDGNKKQSVLNVVGYKEGTGEEGAWDEWSRNLSSQVLSKQMPQLAKKQLKESYDLKKEEYDEIMSLTNPAVKQTLLTSFADSCDSDAVHLKAAALPRQSTKVLIPITSLKPNEVYAPGYLTGDRLALIRHPHGGLFEIPEVVVNNNNREGKKVIEDAKDLMGIHPKVAQRLSGADFDGDTIIAVPNEHGFIHTKPAIKELTNFDHKAAYPYHEGMKVMDKHTKQIKMGDVSNLITDMTIKGASDDEIARAVKHSMVVIDAEKHKLNYTQSYIDNNIAQLKKKYQGATTAGASTLISRAGSEQRVNERRELRPKKGEPVTGNKIYEETGRTYFKTKFIKDPDTGKKVYLQGQGKFVRKQTKSTQMAEHENAFDLSSGTEIEKVYASHANALKELGRTARISLSHVDNLKYSPSAKKIYAPEVDILKSKLAVAYRNKPFERQAQLVAGRIVRAKRKANPDMEAEDFAKIRGQAIVVARTRVGAGKEKIPITDREWEAIQAGAISHNVLKNILANTDPEILKQRAMPRYSTPLSPVRTSRAKSMRALGHTYAEIASALGVSINVVEEAVK